MASFTEVLFLLVALIVSLSSCLTVVDNDFMIAGNSLDDQFVEEDLTLSLSDVRDLPRLSLILQPPDYEFGFAPDSMTDEEDTNFQDSTGVSVILQPPTKEFMAQVESTKSQEMKSGSDSESSPIPSPKPSSFLQPPVVDFQAPLEVKEPEDFIQPPSRILEPPTIEFRRNPFIMHAIRTSQFKFPNGQEVSHQRPAFEFQPVISSDDPVLTLYHSLATQPSATLEKQTTKAKKTYVFEKAPKQKVPFTAAKFPSVFQYLVPPTRDFFVNPRLNVRQ